MLVKPILPPRYFSPFVTLFQVAAQRRRAAFADRVDHLGLLVAQLVLLPVIIYPAPQYGGQMVFALSRFGREQGDG
jgi:hypothetical protein